MRNPLEIRRTNKNPFRELQQMQANMDRLFEELTPQWGGLDSSFSYFNPTCDISEDKTHYYLKFDMPGVPKDQIKVELNDNVLTVSAERKEEKKREGLRRFMSEVSYGSYMRSLRLPTAVDDNKIDASYEDGVLSISIPKSEAPAGKQISVH